MPLLPFDMDDIPDDPGDGSAYIARLNQLTDEALEIIDVIVGEWIEENFPGERGDEGEFSGRNPD